MHRPNKLFVIAIYGRQGAGKTALADFLHDQLPYTAHIGVDHIKRFISEFREIPSHQQTSRKVINAMVTEYLKNGINVIVEQNMSKEEIEALQHITQEYDADFFTYRLEADEQTLSKRVAERTSKLSKPEIPQEELDKGAYIFNNNDYVPTRSLDSAQLDIQAKADVILKDLDY